MVRHDLPFVKCMLTVPNHFLLQEHRNVSQEDQLRDSPRDKSETDQPVDPQVDLLVLFKNGCTSSSFSSLVRDFLNLHDLLKVIALSDISQLS